MVPQEDTFVLLDALEQDSDILRRVKPTLCLEIGFGSASVDAGKGDNNRDYSSGSGCVSAFMGRILGPSDSCE
jgi:release factor glutamine methyltransferase